MNDKTGLQHLTLANQVTRVEARFYSIMETTLSLTGQLLRKKRALQSRTRYKNLKNNYASRRLAALQLELDEHKKKTFSWHRKGLPIPPAPKA
jgi:hypothetical protein